MLHYVNLVKPKPKPPKHPSKDYVLQEFFAAINDTNRVVLSKAFEEFIAKRGYHVTKK